MAWSEDGWMDDRRTTGTNSLCVETNNTVAARSVRWNSSSELIQGELVSTRKHDKLSLEINVLSSYLPLGHANGSVLQILALTVMDI